MLSHLFERRLSLSLLLLCVPLLFLPKINLIAVAGESAGLRLDDFVLLLAAIPILWMRLHHDSPLSAIEQAFLLFLFAGLGSLMTGYSLYLLGLLPEPPIPLYLARQVEYFIFFYVGLLYSRFFPPIPLLSAWLALNLILILLQYSHLIPSFSTSGNFMDGYDAVTGLTNGHWEIGCALGMLYATLAWTRPPHPLFQLKGAKLFLNTQGLSYLTWVGSLGLCLLILASLTGGRAGFASIWMLLVLTFGRTLSKTGRMLQYTGLVLISAFGLLVAQSLSPDSSNPLLKRSSGLLSPKNLEVVAQIYERTDIERVTYQDSYQVPDRSNLLDQSWFIRIHKWLYMIKTFLSQPCAWLLGVGPGYCQQALDGGALRLLIEHGVVGLLLYGMLLWRIAQQSEALMGCVLVLLLNMVFLDTYLAYKTMSLFFFIVGSQTQLRKLTTI